MITLWRIFLAGGRNFLRNAWLSTAATAVMTVTLVIILASFISNTALTATIKTIVDKIDVSIYLDDKATPDQIKTFQSKLAATENVQSVKYVSKAEALEIYKQQNRNNPTLLSAVADPEIAKGIPASLQVKAKDPKRLDPIVALVARPEIKPLVSEFSYEGDRKTTIDRIVQVSNFLKTTGLVASLLFTIISVLIIFNTIRMAIFTRRGEIEIMKLVGATNWFIRGPFLFEAALYGVIAAVIAVGLCYSLLLVGGPRLGSYIDVQSTINYFRSYPALILATELLIGVGIGMLSSLLAMTRYLKL